MLLKTTNYITKVAEIDIKLSSLDDKITRNKNELDKTTNDTVRPFLENMLFNSEDGSQAYLIFQLIYRYFKTIINTNYILSWKSGGLSAESIKPPTTSDNSLNPELSYIDDIIRVKFT